MVEGIVTGSPNNLSLIRSAINASRHVLSAMNSLPNVDVSTVVCRLIPYDWCLLSEDNESGLGPPCQAVRCMIGVAVSREDNF